MLRYSTLRRLSPLTRAAYHKFVNVTIENPNIMESHLVNIYDALNNVAGALTEIELHDESYHKIYSVYNKEFRILDRAFRKCLKQTLKLVKMQCK